MAILSHLRIEGSARLATSPTFPSWSSGWRRSCSSKRGLRIVTNAGGLNPAACATRCAEILVNAGLGQIGDRRRHGRRRAGPASAAGSRMGSTSLTWRPGHRSRPWSTGWWPPTSTSAPGRSPSAIACGRRIVVTGRVADASLDARAGGRPIRLGLGRLGQAGRRVGRRSPDRVRRPGDRRALERLGRASRPRRDRLSDRRDRRRRLMCRSPSRQGPADG